MYFLLAVVFIISVIMQQNKKLNFYIIFGKRFPLILKHVKILTKSYQHFPILTPSWNNPAKIKFFSGSQILLNPLANPWRKLPMMTDLFSRTILQFPSSDPLMNVPIISIGICPYLKHKKQKLWGLAGTHIW